MIKYFLILVLQFYASSGVADEILLSSDMWCPYACDPAAEKPGFMVEIAKELFIREGHTVNYKLMNWARAISETREGKFTGIIGSSRTDAPDFIFPSKPQGKSLNYFWIKKNNSWRYLDPSSIIGKKIGVINAYSYGEEIDLPIQNKNPAYIKVAGDDALVKMIKMTSVGRLDAFIENPNVLSYQLMTRPKYANLFTRGSINITKDTDLFVAFSPANSHSKKYAEILTKGIEELRKSGRLKIILAKYGILDWK